MTKHSWVDSFGLGPCLGNCDMVVILSEQCLFVGPRLVISIRGLGGQDTPKSLCGKEKDFKSGCDPGFGPGWIEGQRVGWIEGGRRCFGSSGLRCFRKSKSLKVEGLKVKKREEEPCSVFRFFRGRCFGKSRALRYCRAQLLRGFAPSREDHSWAVRAGRRCFGVSGGGVSGKTELRAERLSCLSTFRL